MTVNTELTILSKKVISDLEAINTLAYSILAGHINKLNQLKDKTDNDQILFDIKRQVGLAKTAISEVDKALLDLIHEAIR